MLLDQQYPFNPVQHFSSYIKVFGVGGGGCNAVRHMFNQGIEDIDFIICNTDRQSLDESPIEYKIQLGNQTINQKGIGTGMKADQGREAALESEAEIRRILEDDTEMLFITAGMGGGTGTGAAPVIARIANELGILTVAIVTAPFEDEGVDKIEQARDGIRELQQYCDTVVVILNEKLLELYPDMTVDDAYAKADDVLANAVRCISEIVTKSGKINADMNDVKTILKNAGQAVIGLYTAEGENRAITCVEEALSSPLLDNRDIKGAKRILITISYSGKNPMRMWEHKKITQYIEQRIGGKARLLKTSPILDDSLGEAMRFTIIAAGFELSEEGEYIGKNVTPVLATPAPSPQQPASQPVVAAPLARVKDAERPLAKAPEPEPEVVEEAEPEEKQSWESREQQMQKELWPDDSYQVPRWIDEFARKLGSAKTLEWEAELEQPAYQRYNLKLADIAQIRQAPKVSYFNLND